MGRGTVLRDELAHEILVRYNKGSAVGLSRIVIPHLFLAVDPLSTAADLR